MVDNIGHIRKSNHINVSLIHVLKSAFVHIMAVDPLANDVRGIVSSILASYR